jgi:hypothetical protein
MHDIADYRGSHDRYPSCRVTFNQAYINAIPPREVAMIPNHHHRSGLTKLSL